MKPRDRMEAVAQQVVEAEKPDNKKEAVPQQVGETEKPDDKSHVNSVLLADWRKLRQQRPELFQEVVVWQQPAAIVDPVLCRWANESKEAEQPAHRTEEKRPDRSMAEWMKPRQKRPEICQEVVVSHQPGSNTPSFQPLDPATLHCANESNEAEQPADRTKEKRTRNWRVRPEVYEYGYSMSERW